MGLARAGMVLLAALLVACEDLPAEVPLPPVTVAQTAAPSASPVATPTATLAPQAPATPRPVATATPRPAPTPTPAATARPSATPSPTPTTAPARWGTIVPLYSWPTAPAWRAIAEGARRHPSVPVMAIVNPINGVGGAAEPAYVEGIKALQAAGIQPLAYVSTRWASKTARQVEQEMAQWRRLYPEVTGVFFDEMGYRPGQEGFYLQVAGYARSHGMPVVVGNPGLNPPQSFHGITDVMFIYEDPGLPDVSGWDDKERAAYGVIPYGVPTLDASWFAAASGKVGWLYVTSDGDPNPWDTLTDYWDELLTRLEALNGG